MLLQRMQRGIFIKSIYAMQKIFKHMMNVGGINTYVNK